MQPSDEMIRAGASILLGRVNAPEQEIYSAFREALTAALAQGVGVAVRELEWTAEEDDVWRAGDYKITKRAFDGAPSYYVSRGNWVLDGPFGKLRAAQAAAQSDYEARIRSALVAGAVEAEPVAAKPICYLKRDNQRVIADGFYKACAKSDPGAFPVFASPPEELERVKRERDEARAWAKDWHGVCETICTILELGALDADQIAGAVRDKFDALKRERDETRFAVAHQTQLKEFAQALWKSAESQLAEARAQLAALSREGGE